MSKSAGGQRQTEYQNTNGQTGVDATTRARMQEIYDAARQAGYSGPSPLVTGASGYNTDAMKAGATGMSALSGDPTATGLLMNPYQSQVVDATNAQWDNNDARARMATNDAATKAGAFGGGRHGVAEGVAIGENNRNRTGQVAGLLNTGYDNTMTRAGQLAGMGFAGSQANAGLGMAGVGNPQQWLMEMLKTGFMGPTGQTTSGQSNGARAGTEFNASWSGGDLLKGIGGLFGMG